MANVTGSQFKAGPGLTEKTKEATSAVADKAKEVAHTAGNVAATVGQKAEDAAAAVGSGMQSLAGTIRDNGPHEGVVSKATSAVADTLESGGRYLQEEGLSGIGQDLANLIRRSPVPAILIGIGIGYLLARATRS
jgi:hypothetical protein